MIIILSPAKTLDFQKTIKIKQHSLPEFINKVDKLASKLKKHSPKQLSDLLNISTRLANLNYDRYQEWDPDFSPDNAKQAVFVFKGDVYIGLEAEKFDGADLSYAQDHLRILSGLYGILKPLDLIRAYRLEMGSGFSLGNSRNLHEYWKEEITGSLNKAMGTQQTLINLASNEYFKAVDKKKLKARIITPVFKDYKNGKYKIISFFAKKARGQMASFIIRNRLEDADSLKHFEADGYFYNDKLSTEQQIVFTRG
ncbi:MAG: peroxide stress protein YaaA [Bacteroidales bacterium]|nr:peroxide stress protein YaaA [Bacteroidales bacterium]